MRADPFLSLVSLLFSGLLMCVGIFLMEGAKT